MRLPLRATVVLSVSLHAGAAVWLVAPRNRAVEPPGLALDPAPQIAGETFELPAPDTSNVGLANASPSPDEAPKQATAASADDDGMAAPTPPKVKPKAGARPSHAHTPSAGAAAPAHREGASSEPSAPSLYGAVGDRSAADVATAFTRGFPQAASADPVWRTAPLGAAGDAVVTITIDEQGHVESTAVGGSPSRALASAITRTLALVRGRTFVAPKKTTTLHLTARVSTDEIHDGLHGDVFAIGGSFQGSDGSAFFALAVGRRIDLHVRAR